MHSFATLPYSMQEVCHWPIMRLYRWAAPPWQRHKLLHEKCLQQTSLSVRRPATWHPGNCVILNRSHRTQPLTHLRTPPSDATIGHPFSG